MKYKKCIEKITRLDHIRLFKLIEIIYYTLISMMITLIITNILEEDSIVPYVFKTYDYSEVSGYELLKDIIIDLTILVVYIYYLKKCLSCIPSIMIFLPSGEYISNKKNEAYMGVGLGTGIIIYTSLPTIKDKLKELDIRIKKWL